VTSAELAEDCELDVTLEPAEPVTGSDTSVLDESVDDVDEPLDATLTGAVWLSPAEEVEPLALPPLAGEVGADAGGDDPSPGDTGAGTDGAVKPDVDPPLLPPPDEDEAVAAV
jgi:hypothetical protein